MNSVKAIAVAGLMTWTVLPCRADVLVIDLNPVPEEVAAITEAARARGEATVVVPPGNLSADGSNLPEAVAATAGNRRITTVVVTGHHDQGHFFNKGVSNGLNVTAEQLAAAFSGPQYRDSLRFVLLLGCYATSAPNLNLFWPPAFPTALAIAGFDGSAPAAAQGYNRSFIADFFAAEDRMAAVAAAPTAAQVDAIFRSLRAAASGNVTGSLYLAGFFVDHRHAAASLESALQACDASEQQALETQSACFMSGGEAQGCANPAYANPPADTQNGPLREYYTDLQQNRFCDDIHTEAYSRKVARARYLLFYRNVVTHLVERHEAEISALNQFLTAAAQANAGSGKGLAPNALDPRALATISRREALERVAQAGDMIQRLQGQGERIDPRIEAAAEALDAIIRALNPTCIPGEWVEDYRGAQSSACFAPRTR